MFRKWILLPLHIAVLIAALISVLFAVLWFSPAAASKTYRAERFAVHVAIQPGGDLLVTETIDFRFEGGPFTYVFREIPFTELDDVVFLNAAIDDRNLQMGYSAGQVEIEETRPLKVVWHFVPTSDAVHTFTLNYRVSGAIRQGNEDVLSWRAVPQEHEYPIDRAEITFSYPDNVEPLVPPEVDRFFITGGEGRNARLVVGNLGEDEDLVFRLRFPAGSLGAPQPRWQAEKIANEATYQRFLPIGVGGGILAFLLGGFGFLTYAIKNRRDIPQQPEFTANTLPADIPPSLAARLTGCNVSFFATFLDLARRGVLGFIEGQDEHRKSVYVLEKKASSELLQPHEEMLLNSLFPSEAWEIKLQDVFEGISGYAQGFSDAVDQEMIRKGWLDPIRKKRSTRLQFIFILLLLLSIGGVILGFFLAEHTILIPLIIPLGGICCGLFLVSIPGLIYASNSSILTPAGEEQAARWKGFRKYLTLVSRGKETPIQADAFERYFPFAVAFSLAEPWMKHLKKTAQVPPLSWIKGVNGTSGDFEMFYFSTHGMWSSSSGGDSGGGGGGASGGGSSGAG